MPTAIEPYRQRIGVVADRGVINPRLPDFVDPGPAIGSIGDALLRSQEPRLREEADQAALEAAGSAEIVRDEAGNFVRPEIPPGGGTRYMAVFNRVVRERHVELVTGDFEQQLDRLAADPANFMDPQAFMAAAQGRAEGILQAVPDDIRGSVEPVLTREISERFRGVSHRKASNDRQVMVAGLADTMRANDARGLDILRLGGTDAETRAAPYFERARTARADLVSIAEMNAASVEAGELTVTMNAQTAVRYGTSLDNSRAITMRLATLTTGDLQKIESWAAGVATEDNAEVLGFTFETFQQAVQEPELARRVGVIAGGIARDRLAEARRAEDIAREERRAVEDRAAVTAAIAQGFDGNYTYDERQRRALDNDFLAFVGAQPGQNVDTFMGTPEGRRRAVAYAARTGYLPVPVRDYIESRIYSDGAPAIAELAQNLRNVVTESGVQQGHRLYLQLSPRTRAAIELVERLRRSGETDEAIRARVDAQLRARAPSLQEARGRVVDPEGRNRYNEVRAFQIRRQLRMGPTDHIPGPLLADYDETFRWNLDIFDGDVARASTESARQVGAGWSINPIFIGGVAPRHVSSLPVTVLDLDAAFLRGRGGVPPTATFAPGTTGFRARLETLDIGPQAGLGRYRVHIYTASGQEIGAYDVDADAQLAPRIRTNLAARRRAGQGQVQAQRDRRDAARERRRRNPEPFVAMPAGR